MKAVSDLHKQFFMAYMILAAFVFMVFYHAQPSYAAQPDGWERLSDVIIHLPGSETIGASGEPEPETPHTVEEPPLEALTLGYSQGAVAGDIAAIRQDLDILLYLLFPLSVAVLLFVKLCKWFYSTFIQSAF